MSRRVTRSQAFPQNDGEVKQSQSSRRKRGMGITEERNNDQETQSCCSNNKTISQESTTNGCKLKRESRRTIDREVVKKRILEKALTTFQTGFCVSAMISRRKEFEEIRNSIVNSLKSGISTAIYACGAPGTGKTSTILQLIESLKRESKQSDFDYSYVNGVMVTSVDELLESFISPLRSLSAQSKAPNGRTKTAKSSKSNKPAKSESEEQIAKVLEVYKQDGLLSALDRIHEYKESKRPTIVILDEADQINNLPWKRSISTNAGIAGNRDISSSQSSSSLLENLIRSSIQPKSKLILVSISNSLALGTGLKEAISGSNTAIKKKPTRSQNRSLSLSELLNVVIFQTYSDEELRAILDKRFKLAKEHVMHTLESEECDMDDELKRFIELFEPIEEIAIRLTLKKLAAHQGDCRQMLDVCRDLLSRNLAKTGGGHQQDARLNNKRRQCCEDDQTSSSSVSSDVESFESPLKKLRHSDDESSDDSEKGREPSITSDSSLSHSSNLKSRLRQSRSTASTIATTPTSRSRSPDQHRTPPRYKQRQESTSSHSSSLSSRYDDLQMLNDEEVSDRLSMQVQKITLHDTQSVLNHYFEHPKSRCFKLLSHAPLHQQVLLFAVCQAIKDHLKSLKECAVNNDHDSQCVDGLVIQNGYKSFCKLHQLSEEYNSINLVDGLTGLEQSGILRIHHGTTQRKKPTSTPLRSTVGSRSFNTKRMNNRNQSISVELVLESSNVEEVLGELKSVFKRTFTTDNEEE